MDLVKFTGEILNEKLHFLCIHLFYIISKGTFYYNIRNGNKREDCRFKMDSCRKNTVNSRYVRPIFNFVINLQSPGSVLCNHSPDRPFYYVVMELPPSPCPSQHSAGKNENL